MSEGFVVKRTKWSRARWLHPKTFVRDLTEVRRSEDGTNPESKEKTWVQRSKYSANYDRIDWSRKSWKTPWAK